MTTVSGTGVAGSSVTVTLPGGAIETITVGEDGTWTVTVEPLSANDVVSATQTEVGKAESSPATTTVQALEPSSVPTVNPVKDGDTTVTRTSVPGATITVTVPGSDPVTAVVDDTGSWSVTVPPVKAGDTITATQTEPGKGPSEDTTVTVDPLPPSAPPTINPVTDGDTTIGGTGTPGSTVTVTLPDGTTKDTTVKDDGT